MPQEHYIKPELLGYWLPALSEAACFWEDTWRLKPYGDFVSSQGEICWALLIER